MAGYAVVDVPTALGLSPVPGSEGRARGTWRAPAVLREEGLLERLGLRDAATIEVRAYDAERERTGGRNTAAVAGQTRALAVAVSAVIDAGERPLVLGGDCSVLLGAMLALRRRGRFGLVFVDGHLDFRHTGNTAQLSAVAGEDLAIVTGRGPSALSDIDGLRPYVADRDVVAIGERENDAATADIHDSAIEVVDIAALRDRGMAAVASASLDRLRDGGAAGTWVHVDLDVLDSELLPAVDSPQPGGLDATELVELLRTLTADPLTIGVEVTIYDPELDLDRRGATLITDILAEGLIGPGATRPCR